MLFKLGMDKYFKTIYVLNLKSIVIISTVGVFFALVTFSITEKKKRFPFI